MDKTLEKTGIKLKKRLVTWTGTKVREGLTNAQVAFLDFVSGKKPTDSLTEKLSKEVQKARDREEWRSEYMTLYGEFSFIKWRKKKKPDASNFFRFSPQTSTAIL